MNTSVTTNRERCRVDEGYACTGSHAAQMQIKKERHANSFSKDIEAFVADEVGKFMPQMLADVVQVEGLEIAVMGLMEQNQDGHNFALG